MKRTEELFDILWEGKVLLGGLVDRAHRVLAMVIVEGEWPEWVQHVIKGWLASMELSEQEVTELTRTVESVDEARLNIAGYMVQEQYPQLTGEVRYIGEMGIWGGPVHVYEAVMRERKGT